MFQSNRVGIVAADAVEVIEDEQESIEAALRMGERGDLLVIFGDNITRCWKQIVNFGGGEGGGEPAARAGAIGGLTGKEAPPQPVEPVETSPADEQEIEPVRDERPLKSTRSGSLIVDERGVRLARQEND